MTVPPIVSVVIPTLNAERTLDECLSALLSQNWPRDRLEILLIDAGSSDRTLAIAESHGVDHVFANALKTGEAGKAAGVKAARGELLLLLDSDNVTVGPDWLARMTAPFAEDPAVIAAEPMRWDVEGARGLINRWHAMSGVADPLTLHLGNYARESLLTGTWTGMQHVAEARAGWERVTLRPDAVPVLGANGFMLHRRALDIVPVADYYFDLDYVHALVVRGEDVVARVDVPIRHDFCEDVAGYVRKTRRRADDFFFFSSEEKRSYPWTSQRTIGLLRFILSTVFVVPVLVEAMRGWRQRRDIAWLFHLPACWITLVVYGIATIRGRLAPKAVDRESWKQ